MPSIIWNTRALNDVLNSRTGAVGKDLAKRAVRVESSAKSHFEPHAPGANRGIPIGGSGGVGPQVGDTGRLRSSITWRYGSDTRGLYADIGSNVTYAAPVEMGHILIRNGQVVGKSPPYAYLRPALPAASRP